VGAFRRVCLLNLITLNCNHSIWPVCFKNLNINIILFM
jgi:hypothetical protein